MKSIFSNKLVLFFGLLAFGSLILEIITASDKRTVLETTLFGILQFIFTVYFTWVIAKLSFTSQFEESIKRFAIAAYRRILEIENRLIYLSSHVKEKANYTSSIEKLNYDTILAITDGIRETTKSSNADWCDIIGEELSKMEEVKRIRNDRDELEDRIGLETKTEMSQNHKITDKLEKYQEEIDLIVSSLPYSLKKLLYERDEFYETIKRIKEDIADNMIKAKVIQLEAFWDKTFERDIKEYSVGDKLNMYLGDYLDRKSVFLLKDDDNRNIGLVVNNLVGISYQEFVKVIIRVIKNDNTVAEITEISNEIISGRKYFYLLVYLNQNSDMS